MAAQDASTASLVKKIVVRLVIGDHRMASTVDPVYLRLIGRCGREFRLDLAHGKTLRRGTEDLFIFGAPDDPDTNVAHPDLNDPTQPPLAAAGIERVLILKGIEPIPNVRGLGEFDDRLLLQEVEVEVHSASDPKPKRFQRSGPIWLGLQCGHSFELPASDDSA